MSLKEITGDKTRTNLTKQPGERTLLTFPDREPRLLSATAVAYTGNPAVKMFIGTDAEVTAEKVAQDAKYAPIKAAMEAAKEL